MNMSSKRLKIDESMWMLTTGEYSDYRVLAVTADKNTAKEWADFCNVSGDRSYPVEVETIPVIPTGRKPYKESVWRASLDLWDNGREGGEITPTVETDVSFLLWEKPPNRPMVRRVRTPWHRSEGGRVDVVGRTRESVVKCLQEQLTMWRSLEDKRGFWG